ncbi:GNAT family N-acetyltransferase [Cytobacillus dafuensis]|uniref:GNAT family N-acetyltransferase n=2 Tax=Cytobacillus dafuensis TaxID=1742359 RepID=A0A5B8Z0Q1_CYTDA|nr:GNAT family protein [Cytobacillus dafuensis]QED46351.1 GNAT family N-acetyltransferase [Cytobacillus dafuensis]
MTKLLSLIGQKVIIRPIEEADLKTFWTYIYGTENPEWKKWDAPYFPLVFKEFENFKKTFIPKPTDGAIPRMAIEADGKLIGSVSYYWEHKESNWLEAGIAIYDPEYWNGGYGTEALTLWVDYLFSSMPLVRVGITTWSGNKRMMRAAEKIGMKLEGRMRKCRYHNGEYYDSIRMGVLREEWNGMEWSGMS